MRTLTELSKLVKQRNAQKRYETCHFKNGGDLQCSVGFISGFGGHGSRLLDFCYKGFVGNGYDVAPLAKDAWPAIWLFTMTSDQMKLQVNQDIIVGLNATEVYEYLHKGHGRKIHLHLAERQYFNYDYMYDVCEQQLKEEGSIK
jgi:hypothetical protein